MTNQRTKLASLIAVLLIVSATCSGFLVGRTVKLQQEGKMEQIQQVGERMVTFAGVVHRGVEVVKKVALR